MTDFEKLGVFYLGRVFDREENTRQQGLFLYDSRDLLTHAICVGMTGSGKTGLCLSLVEEAALDSIPVIAIDPKGDLSNLLLTFPEMQTADFLPWINPEDARRSGQSDEEFAAEQAAVWEEGLKEWDQTNDRIRRLKESSDFLIYTPGSVSGLPVSILNSFSAPPTALQQDPELLAEKVKVTASSLLSLLGVEADSLRSREHILISSILSHYWKQNQDLDLPALVGNIQTPPFDKLGALDINTFYPAAERFVLAMSLNNLLAAPGFELWLKGQPLDIDRILYSPQGKPRTSIFSIAHLSDSERMFFVTLLLNQVLSWMRSQPGTTSLRAILYIDEIFGYFPPVANPPSKEPLLTLLKQARAFGLGVVLATQNPVDLDYKGLANTGTWFIGRLQTERDQARLMDGLQSASSGSASEFNRQKIESMLGRLRKRLFLAHDVHETEPLLFETRWTMSYLRGPMTREQIRSLMEKRKAEEVQGVASATPERGSQASDAEVSHTPTAKTLDRGPAVTTRMLLPPEIKEYFLPINSAKPEGAHLVYAPLILGAAAVRFRDTKSKVEASKNVIALVEIKPEAIPVCWPEASLVDLELESLLQSPQAAAAFKKLPAVAHLPKAYATFARDFISWLTANQKLTLFKSSAAALYSSPEESERSFRIRLQQASHEHRDKLAEKLRSKYAARIATLQDKIFRAQQTLAAEEEELRQQQMQTAISVGATLLGAFTSRRSSSLGRATTAARGASRTVKEQQDVARAQAMLATLNQQLSDLEDEFKIEMQSQATDLDPCTQALDTIAIRPRKTDVTTLLVALVWMPHWQDVSTGDLRAAWS